MWINPNTGGVFRTHYEVRAAFPGISMPSVINEKVIDGLGLFPVNTTEQPAIDPKLQRIEVGQPVNQSGQWVQTWNVIDLTQEEIAQHQAARAEETRQLRKAAYEQEADPLFFKWQRGEGTQDAWLAKVAEIKARFPD